MMQWKITYYNKRVFNEIKKMPMTLAGKYIALTQRMKIDGPDLGMPHTRAMSNGLFEIRVKGQEGIARIFYCVQKGKEIIILHSFIKKTQQTPKHELDIARQHLKEVKENG